MVNVSHAAIIAHHCQEHVTDKTWDSRTLVSYTTFGDISANFRTSSPAGSTPEGHFYLGEVSQDRSKRCALHTTSLNLDRNQSRATRPPKPVYRGSVVFLKLRTPTHPTSSTRYVLSNPVIHLASRSLFLAPSISFPSHLPTLCYYPHSLIFGGKNSLHFTYALRRSQHRAKYVYIYLLFI